MTKRPNVEATRVTLEQLTADPHPHLARMRAEAPVAWVPALEAWLVTSRDHAVRVLRDADTFTVDDPRFSTARVVGPSMLSLDGAAHVVHRSAFAEHLRVAPSSAGIAVAITTHAETLVSEFSGAGSAELRTQLAAPLAVQVIADVLGLTAVGPERVLGWYRKIVATVDAVTRSPDHAIPDGITGELEEAVLATADADPASLPGQVRATSPLTDSELVSNLAVVMFGAIETSEGAIANLLHHVLVTEGSFDRLRVDGGARPAAIEESLRLEPAAAVVDRYATRDAEVGDASIAAGDEVIVSLAAANRDPAVFDEPDVFNIDRVNSSAHLTFAQGPHLCLGTHLARAEARAALDSLLENETLRDLVIDPDAPRPRGLVFRKPDAVPVNWTIIE